MSAVHVLPVDDLIEHLDDGECPCGPTPEFVEGGVVWVHHSLDGREQAEAPKEDSADV